jgi:serine/threonine-protein kinase
MSGPSPPEPPALSEEAARRFEQACDRFEEAWQAGVAPDVEAFLDGWSGPERQALRDELFLIDAEHRARAAGSTAPGDDRPTGPEAPASPPPPCPSSFGDYELLEELGRGGMGVVYRARDRRLNRFVALKVLHAGLMASPDAVRRGRDEAAKAALDHPHVVPVHDSGEHEGRHYFVMKLMEGGSMSRLVERGPTPPGRAALWVLDVTRAIEAAHKAGLIHRDLKPANILLDRPERAGEPPSEAERPRAHVADFGLAKWLGREASLTATGDVVGTVGYMAPEQADGKAGLAADVYGLGAVLYALLTGRPPFQAENALDTLDQVRHLAPVPPRLLSPKVDRDLEAICLKCLEKAPERRYAGAADLAEDLECYLAGKPPPHARRGGLLSRLLRPIEHHLQVGVMRQWSRACLANAALVLLGHGLVFGLLRTGQPIALVWSALAAQWGLLALGLWAFLIRQGRSAHPVEGHALAAWIGSTLAVPVLFLGPGMGRAQVVLAAYPALALINGLVVFAHGSLYSGRCYLVGLAYFALALVMKFRPEWAPLEYGLFHGGYLAFVGWRLRAWQTRPPAGASV